MGGDHLAGRRHLPRDPGNAATFRPIIENDAVIQEFIAAKKQRLGSRPGHHGSARLPFRCRSHGELRSAGASAQQAVVVVAVTGVDPAAGRVLVAAAWLAALSVPRPGGAQRRPVVAVLNPCPGIQALIGADGHPTAGFARLNAFWCPDQLAAPGEHGLVVEPGRGCRRC